jgi:hypothetical protein
MTTEEKEIGAKWLAILNAYNDDFATKSLFNQTSVYLKTMHSGTASKKTSRFQQEVKTPELKRSLVKPMSLLEASKLREERIADEEEEEEMGNLLAMSETVDFVEIPKKGRKKNA